jgi:glycosyltransferase involved in cell wall biosynthesis
MRHNKAPLVVVNGRFLARHITGVERYGREILRCMDSNPALSLSEGYRVESTHRQGWMGHAWEQFILPSRLHQGGILWSPTNTGPLMVRNQALTIHDLSPLEHPEWFRKSFSTWYRMFLPILAKRVFKIFTPSEYVKKKVEKRFGRKDVIVTPNGVDHAIFCPGAIQNKFDLPDYYILFVGSLEPRKNLYLLLRTWDEIKTEFKNMWLLIVGVSGTVFKTINFSHKTERVRFLGYVEDEVLAGLYANATAFVLPSHDEGFGLPALEAMASGSPVIVSDGGALPEVVSEAGMIFCLSNPEGLKQTLAECLSNVHLRRELRERGLKRAQQFSWQFTAELVWKNLIER